MIVEVEDEEGDEAGDEADDGHGDVVDESTPGSTATHLGKLSRTEYISQSKNSKCHCRFFSLCSSLASVCCRTYCARCYKKNKANIENAYCYLAHRLHAKWLRCQC